MPSSWLLLVVAVFLTMPSIEAISTLSTPQNALILSKVQSALPRVESIGVTQTIEQASAIGYKLKLSYGENKEESDPEEVFLKQVTASKYVPSKKDWPDLRRALLYARTEARFYHEFAPLLQQNNNFNALPNVYFASYNLEGWIQEDETGHLHEADPSIDKDKLLDGDNRGGTLILECISPDTHYQDSPLTVDQCKLALTGVARLHAAAWEDQKILALAEKRLSRCSFHLSMRNPKELAGIVQAWENFVANFQDDMKEAGVWSESVANLGSRVNAIAEYVSSQVSVTKEDEPFATLVHGDYKSMNVFLPVDPKDQALLVDFASVGTGLGMSDVAMHVHHAVVAETLDSDDTEKQLVDHYWKEVCTSLVSDQAREDYTWDVAYRHYKFAVVDYFRFFLGRFWKVSTHESMNKLRDNKNTNLINRSVPAAVAFVARVDRYVAFVESEFKS